MIPVTKPFLPPKSVYTKYLDGIWERQWLTNMGPLANELEQRLQQYLNTVPGVLFVTNATIALQMAIKALELTGEIITTPFSFVATSSTIVWEGCKPVFVDIDPHSLNIDADKIEAAITEHTSAILATHVYGNPCDVVKIEEIAQKHNLKVIYDGAHAFGVNVNGKSIFEFGDISVCSLHATKLYHSTEGGIIITSEEKLKTKLAFMRNFGFNGPEAFAELGINGKNSEFHAAMGLANLEYADAIIDRRKVISERYHSHLKTLDITIPEWHKDANKNYAYFPVIFDSEKIMLEVMDKLQKLEIFTRRYFYPSLANTLPYVASKSLEVTDDICRRVLCLPLYFDLADNDVDFICAQIEKCMDKSTKVAT